MINNIIGFFIMINNNGFTSAQDARARSSTCIYKLSNMAERREPFQRAKQLLIGAVDAVIQLASQGESASSNGSTARSSGGTAGPTSNSLSLNSATTRGSCSTNALAIAEHSKLFGFKPSKATTKSKSRSGRKKQPSKPKVVTWKKDCILLKDSQQTWKPSPEEKIDLARMGLGLSQVTFDCSGDSDHVHHTLISAFPVLDTCGGYSLLRLGENSHGLLEIEGPESGITVPFLKDVLNQAKLYIRPLQCDITEEAMKPFVSAPDVSFIKLNNIATLLVQERFSVKSINLSFCIPYSWYY